MDSPRQHHHDGRHSHGVKTHHTRRAGSGAAATVRGAPSFEQQAPDLERRDPDREEQQAIRRPRPMRTFVTREFRSSTTPACPSSCTATWNWITTRIRSSVAAPGTVRVLAVVVVRVYRRFGDSVSPQTGASSTGCR